MLLGLKGILLIKGVSLERTDVFWQLLSSQIPTAGMISLQVWGTQYLTSVYTSHWSLEHGAPLSLYYLDGHQLLWKLVELRGGHGQLTGVGFLNLPCRLWNLNLGCQVWLI